MEKERDNRIHSAGRAVRLSFCSSLRKDVATCDLLDDEEDI